MTGTVKFILASRRRVALLTERQDFSVMEVLDMDGLGMEDRLLWSGEDPLGEQTLRNGARACDLKVRFLAHRVAAAQVGPALMTP